MPALRYCSRSGDHKARIAALRVGESLVVGCRAEASYLRGAAVRIGVLVSVRCLTRGQPAQRVTVLGDYVPTIERARRWRHSSHGSRPIPAIIVRAMHADYQRTGSLARTAATFGRTKQDLAYIFRRRGLPVKSRGGSNRRKQP